MPYLALDPSMTVVFSIEDSQSMFTSLYRASIGSLSCERFDLAEFLPWVNEWIVQVNIWRIDLKLTIHEF